MKSIVAVLLMVVLTLQGCAVLGDRRVAAGCQVADGFTTYYALKHGAVELNPLLGGMSPAAILILKLTFAYVIFKALPPKEEATKADQFVGSALTVIGCVPAVNNLKVIGNL